MHLRLCALGTNCCDIQFIGNGRDATRGRFIPCGRPFLAVAKDMKNWHRVGNSQSIMLMSTFSQTLKLWASFCAGVLWPVAGHCCSGKQEGVITSLVHSICLPPGFRRT